MTANKLFLIAAVVCFVLDGVPVTKPNIKWFSFGWACCVIAFLIR
jgi:hypothetical protein